MTLESGKLPERANGSIHKIQRPSIAQSIGSPRKWLHHYDDFISKNAGAVSQIESSLRTLTYIVPGRFSEVEIASESLNSFIELISLYHNSVLSRVYASLPASIPRPLATPHNRYTKFWTARSPVYRRIATFLQTIKYTELLWEMLARRKGGDKLRWRAVVFLESIKAFCRLILMRLTKSRPLVDPPLPEREVDPRSLEEKTDQADQWDGYSTPPPEMLEQSSAASVASSSDISWTMPRTGLSLPSLPDSSEITDFLLKKVLTADDIKAPKQLLHRMTTLQAQLAEAMWILRPVLYALAMQRLYEHNRMVAEKNKISSWGPWLAGVGLEIAARRLAKKDLNENIVGGMRGLTGLEKEELGKRGWNMAWWGMRGAFYEQYTGPIIKSFTSRLRGKPLLDLVANVVDDYEHLWSDYYFSTSTM